MLYTNISCISLVYVMHLHMPYMPRIYIVFMTENVNKHVVFTTEIANTFVVNTTEIRQQPNTWRFSANF